MKSVKINLTLLSTVISFICISLSLFIILNAPATSGYEISIYDVYPSFLWVLICMPTVILFSFLFFNKNLKFANCILLLIGAIISMMILFSIPLFRGYVFYGAGDTHSQIYLINEIAKNGHIIHGDIYPISHILIYIQSIMLSFTPELVSLYFRPFFIFFYIISMVVFSKCLKCNSIESIFIAGFSIIPVFGDWLTIEYIMPSTECFFMIPLTLYAIIKSRNANQKFAYLLISIILLILFPFFHPEGTIFLLVALACLLIISKLNKKYFLTKEKELNICHNNELIISIIILSIGLVVWLSYALSWGNTITIIYASIISSVFPTAPPAQVILKGFKIDYFDVIKEIFKLYGVALGYLLISIMICIVIFKNMILKKNILSRDLLLSSLFFIFITVNMLFLFLGSPMSYHIYRQIKYSLLASTLILGVYASNYLLKIKNNYDIKYYTIACIFICIIFIASLLGVYNAYSSPSQSLSSLPYANLINHQVTYEDISGMRFFFDHRNELYQILEPIGRAYQNRFADYFGRDDINPVNIRSGYDINVFPPPHFGYDKSPVLGSSYTENQYLLVYPPLEEFYPRLYTKYEQLWRYDSNDLRSLSFDVTIEEIYNNGELKINLVKSVYDKN
ncbi:hypothetical protein Mtc_1454 [Methanocella conradii HZ254]|uniref:Glycosyltransferase RgtA/B/C/D-like domain-containing protein n=1 Tax=Methanocella conradii (strain DSM 24694 / JCM 17849 / CGMCC 1.5162 / HZ254) TaxID=1041930 RepID=H8I4M7_METCZ|nr:hypothetical protein [Methanocella conradii]AFD00206.1 hypothetical protein Mtc_1454 [Methanocella conradii HZ254]